ncbi:MAG: phosphatidylserine decarboxylase family protein [Deltaproteobacteria bacterium]|nr:phosphatidylserine decarboxylase family protein [Deltaproteobacteria bacterium]
MEKFSWPDPPGQTAFPIAGAGYPFIFAGAFVTAVFALLGLVIPAVAGILVTSGICCFFRDPDRVVPHKTGAVVSPADGKIIKAELIEKNRFTKEKCLKISIFMSVFNVHVNRIPCAGKVTDVCYHPGKFFSANLDKASKNNEHNAIFIETETGHSICFVQIAGLIARRIICGLQQGDIVDRGQRFGIICFGSRLDVYLPADSDISVSIGDKVKAGTSILGFLS